MTDSSTTFVPPSPDDEPLRGELAEQLTEALQRVPETAGRPLAFIPISGGITNRNFLVTVGDEADRYVIRLGGNDTHLLGISREVEHAATVVAAGIGIGPEVLAFIRPEGYLVTRFIVGQVPSLAQIHQPTTLARVADSIRRIHGGPAIPGLFVPLRVVEAYRALALERGVRIPDDWEAAQAAGRRIERALLDAPLPLQPCHNDLLRGNFIDDGARLWVVDWEYAGMGDPFFDLGNFSTNHELEPAEDASLLSIYDQTDTPQAARLARLTLMRVVSDFREAMWGVLQQAISTLDEDFAEYSSKHFGRMLRNAAEPRFERALTEVAGG